ATGGAFTLADVTGGEGAWTIPHIHREMEESFFVLEGRFTFTVGDHSVSAGPGSYVLVPRGTPHTLGSGPEGGRCLVLMVPGGLERMFLELARLPGDSLRDPKIRAAVAAKHDSVPV
ncbi:MAG TPA: cupin domain-containing protein, partial [Candidatus Tectomicrobia bacterium]|nr:cupin domain-containing protein [Candidatus Tectomicrobia bacterium]